MKQNSAEMKERSSLLGCLEQVDRSEFYKLLTTTFPLSFTPYWELSYSQSVRKWVSYLPIYHVVCQAEVLRSLPKMWKWIRSQDQRCNQKVMLQILVCFWHASRELESSWMTISMYVQHFWWHMHEFKNTHRIKPVITSFLLSTLKTHNICV